MLLGMEISSLEEILPFMLDVKFITNLPLQTKFG